MAARNAERTEWRQDAYIDWLCTLPKDRDPRTQRDLAEQLGVQEARLSQWKKDPDFLKAWEIRYRTTIGSLEKRQAVLETLYATATDRDDPRLVPAAKAYLDAIEGVRPNKMDVTVTQGKAASQLSDDELLTMLAERAAKEIQARQVADADAE